MKWIYLNWPRTELCNNTFRKLIGNKRNDRCANCRNYRIIYQAKKTSYIFQLFQFIERIDTREKRCQPKHLARKEKRKQKQYKQNGCRNYSHFLFWQNFVYSFRFKIISEIEKRILNYYSWKRKIFIYTLVVSGYTSYDNGCCQNIFWICFSYDYGYDAESKNRKSIPGNASHICNIQRKIKAFYKNTFKEKL